MQPETTDMAPMSDYCVRFHRVAEMIGKRWAPSILRVLLVRPRRFNELLHAIPGISDRLLTERLRELEDSGLVRREVVHDRPIQVEYSLTTPGHDLGHVMVALRDWTEKWMPAEGWPDQGQGTRD